MRQLGGIISTMHVSLSKLRNTVKEREAGCAAVHEVTKCGTRLSNSTTTLAQGDQELVISATAHKFPSSRRPEPSSENQSKGSKTRVVSVRGDEVSWFVGAGNLRSRQQRRSR